MEQVKQPAPVVSVWPHNKGRLRSWCLPIALSLGLHTSGTYSSELQNFYNAPELTVSHFARLIRSALNGERKETLARSYVKHYADSLHKDKPLALDLERFHLQNEKVAGGLSEGDEALAHAAFESFADEFEKLKTQGKSRDEVLGAVIRSVEEHKKGRSFLADILLAKARKEKVRGNCEATMKFVSAMFQRLYPDLVERGMLKVEVFGAYQDKAGKKHVGHVRAVLDEDGERVVLEGDGVTRYVPQKGDAVPAFEATSLALKSFLADQRQYDFSQDIPGHKAQAQKEAQNSPVSFTDSINIYPASTAHYGEQKADMPKPASITVLSRLNPENMSQFLPPDYPRANVNLIPYTVLRKDFPAVIEWMKSHEIEVLQMRPDQLAAMPEKLRARIKAEHLVLTGPLKRNLLKGASLYELVVPAMEDGAEEGIRDLAAISIIVDEIREPLASMEDTERMFCSYKGAFNKVRGLERFFLSRTQRSKAGGWIATKIEISSWSEFRGPVGQELLEQVGSSCGNNTRYPVWIAQQNLYKEIFCTREAALKAICGE